MPEIIQLAHVIYISAASYPMSRSQLGDLLTVSRQRNYRLRLTGLLLYSHQRFIQVLEGPENAVREVFKSIEQDNRHRHIDILRFEQKIARHFPDWRMGFRNFAVSVENLPAISNFLEPDFDTEVFRNESSEAYSMLLEFRSAQDD